MEPMTTVSEVLDNLKRDGYTLDFNLANTCLVCNGNLLQIHPDEFVVDKHYRFEGLSDPGDEAVVYAISSVKHDLKGTLVDGYGIYSDSLSHEMIMALTGKNPDDAKQTNPSNRPHKSNEATPQRPEGTWQLDAPMVQINLNAFREQIKQERAWQNNDRNAITIFKSAGMRIVLIALHEGAEMKTHTAPGMISVQVLEGRIAFTTEEQTAIMETGQMLALHTGIPHSVKAEKESVFLLTLSLGK